MAGTLWAGGVGSRDFGVSFPFVGPPRPWTWGPSQLALSRAVPELSEAVTPAAGAARTASKCHALCTLFPARHIQCAKES